MRTILALLLLAIPVATALAAGDDRVAEIIEQKCMICHGQEGEKSSEIYPRIAGQHRVYLAKQIRNFRDGVRKNEIMNEMAKDLTDAEIDSLEESGDMHSAECEELWQQRIKLLETLEVMQESALPGSGSARGGVAVL